VRLYYGDVLSNDIAWQRYEVNGPIDDAVFMLEPR